MRAEAQLRQARAILRFSASARDSIPDSIRSSLPDSAPDSISASARASATDASQGVGQPGMPAVAATVEARAAGEVTAGAAGVGSTCVASPAVGATAPGAPLPPGWLEALAPDGTVYYYHEVTRET
eukprot:scaffold36551_cov56-Isochrysis_galbana.AAC.1